MTRALGPRVSLWHSSTGAAWLVLAACWTPVAGLWVVWLAAKVCAVAAGGTIMPFGTDFAVALARGQTNVTWPGTPTWLVLLILVLLVTALFYGVWEIWSRIARRLPQPGDPVAVLADNPRPDCAPAGRDRKQGDHAAALPRQVRPLQFGAGRHRPRPGGRPAAG